MKTNFKLHLLLLALWSASGFAQGQGAAIGYQGRLNEGSSPATGFYDFTFTVFGAEAGGAALAGTIARAAVPVTNGLFSVALDFQAGIFTGPARWLEITVRAAGVGDPKILTPRTPLLPTPYAIFADSAGNVPPGTVTADQLNTGGAVPAPGQFLSYDGGSLFWSDPGVAVGNIFSLNGTSAYYNGGNVGIGTDTPAHRLSLAGGPVWTANGWGGAIGLANGSAIGWQGNAAGQRFGMGQSSGGLYFFRTASDPGTTASSALYDLVISDLGNVGIGTTAPTPGVKLEVSGNTLMRPANGTLQFGSPNGELGMSMIPNAGNRADLRFDGSVLKLVASTGVVPPSAANGLAITTGGNVGIGSLTPVGKLEVVAQDALRLVGYQPFLTLLDANAGYAMCRIQGADGKIAFHINDWGSPTQVRNVAVMDANGLSVNGTLVTSGNASVSSLTIRGGADLAEPFAMSDSGVEPGSVVVIDEANPGKLKTSAGAYDKRVAGIVSGANGIRPGISMVQEDKLEAGENVALSGRVYVKADTSSGPIRPGDLLTTSDTAGHAMRVTDHTRSQGAIIGKAMSALKDGKGMVLVLVTLQ